MKVKKKILFPTAQAAVKKGTVAMLCMLLAGLLFTSNVKAQEWFPVGAKWTYSVTYYAPLPPEHYISQMKCVKDTVIEGITAKVLVGGDICGASYRDKNIFYYNDTADILYYYVAGMFRPYFDFSKKAGESYYAYFRIGNHYDSLLVTVVKDTIEPFGGINVRHLYLHHKCIYNEDMYCFPRVVVEYVGGIDRMYPLYFFCDYDIRGLRCYSDNTFSYYAKPIFEEQGCDIILSINELLKEKPLAVFPNPAMDNIQIKTNKEVLQYGTIRIVNPVGQVLATHVLTSNEENISISHLSSGIYFIQYKSDNQLFQTKFIKIR